MTIDLTSGANVSDVKTSSTSPNRPDELAYDADDGILLVINNADDPPFGTLISVNKSTGKLTPGNRITLDMAHVGFDATNGAEQPQYDKRTGKFYLSIPEVNCTGSTDCGGSGPNGGVARIDPHSTGNVEKLFPVDHCQPAGLTVGPDHRILIGCSVAFDTAGKPWSASDKNTAKPESVVLNVASGNQVRVAGVTGSDEVWFNEGDRDYYLAARGNPGGPVMGIINANTNMLVQLVPTLNTAGNPTANPVIVSGTAHSVAVDSHNNHSLVPLSANNVFPNCLNGCIAVFGRPMGKEMGNEHHEMGDDNQQ